MGTDVLLLHLSLLLLCGHSVCIMRVCTCAQAVKGPGWGGGGDCVLRGCVRHCVLRERGFVVLRSCKAYAMHLVRLVSGTAVRQVKATAFV